MALQQQEQIDRAYELLHNYGPATAYDYMQQAGGLDLFPASLIQLVTAQVTAPPRTDLPNPSGMSHGFNGSSNTDVLLIDDDTVLQEVVTVVLRDEQIRAEVCALGWSAQRCIRATQPKVIILDIEMPDINGIQLFDLLRADPRTCDIRVIFLTANPEKVRHELPNYEEMDAVLLPKPFDVERLIAAVKSALAA